VFPDARHLATRHTYVAGDRIGDKATVNVINKYGGSEANPGQSERTVLVDRLPPFA